MTGDLCRVFACIGVGGTEDTHHHLIDDLCTILDVSVVDGVGLCV